MSEGQSEYSGWAILEIFGHQKYAGYVTTQTFGTAVLFRCDVPPLSEREKTTRSGCYLADRSYAPPGSTVKESETPGYSKLFGVGAIYSMTPCDEAAALRAVEELQPRALMLVSLPVGKALGAGALPPHLDELPCCGGNHEEGHSTGCINESGIICQGCHKPIEVCSCEEEDDAR